MLITYLQHEAMSGSVESYIVANHYVVTSVNDNTALVTVPDYIFLDYGPIDTATHMEMYRVTAKIALLPHAIQFNTLQILFDYRCVHHHQVSTMSMSITDGISGIIIYSHDANVTVKKCNFHWGHWVIEACRWTWNVIRSTSSITATAASSGKIV